MSCEHGAYRLLFRSLTLRTTVLQSAMLYLHLLHRCHPPQTPPQTPTNIHTGPIDHARACLLDTGDITVHGQTCLRATYGRNSERRFRRAHLRTIQSSQRIALACLKSRQAATRPPAVCRPPIASAHSAILDTIWRDHQIGCGQSSSGGSCRRIVRRASGTSSTLIPQCTIASC